MKCMYCENDFIDALAYYRHRPMVAGVRRCLAESGMFHAGIRIGKHVLLKRKGSVVIDTSNYSVPTEIEKPMQFDIDMARENERAKAIELARKALNSGLPMKSLKKWFGEFAEIAIADTKKVLHSRMKMGGEI